MDTNVLNHDDRCLSRRGFLAAAGAAAVGTVALAGVRDASAASAGNVGVFAGEYNPADEFEQTGAGEAGTDGVAAAAEVDAATGSYNPGTYVGQATGMGGAVTAEVTVDATSIVNVVLTGDKETPAIGGAALPVLEGQFIDGQTALVDGVGGATVTSTAAREAVTAALKQAAGIEQREWTIDDINLNPGYYSTFVQGHSLTEKMPVMVRTRLKSFGSVDISTSNGETDPIRVTVEENMIPEMIENQSFNVDVVCGATVTSNALKEGVKQCLIQALKDGGTPEEAIEFFAKPVEYAPREQESYDVDVLVVGMGGTGTAAFMAACEAEAAAGKPVSVLAIEKTARTGGTSAMTSSMLAINPPKFQEEHNGGADYVDLAYVDDARVNSPYVDQAKANGYNEAMFAEDPECDYFWDLYKKESGPTLDWLIDHGFYFGTEPTPDFYAAQLMGNFEYAGTMGDQCKMEVKGYFDHMRDDAVALGGECRLFTELVDLVYDEATGRVVGAKARDVRDGTEISITTKQVVLCTGGMGGDKELWGAHCNISTAWNLDGLQTNDGKALAACWRLGAGEHGVMTGMDVHTGAPSVVLGSFPVVQIPDMLDPWIGRVATYSVNDIPLFMVTCRDTLFVNAEGERYATESPTWPMTFAWWLPGDRYYSITSKARLQEIADNGFTHFNTNVFRHHGFNTFPVNTPVPEMFDVVEAAVKAGCCAQADTLEELAEKLGMADVSALARTVADYNDCCAAGVDGQYGKDAAFLKALGDEGPWYAFFGEAEPYGSDGGLSIDHDFRVTKTDGSPLGGVYCAGTDCMGYQPAPFGGTYQGWAFMTGRLAGTNAAHEALGM